MIKTIEEKIYGQIYCFCDSGTDNESDGPPGSGTGPQDTRTTKGGNKTPDRSQDRGIDSRGNTVNFNVDRGKPSVETDQGRVYGTQAQLDEKFGPSQPDTSIPGVSYSPGGGLPTMAQMSGYAGAYSPTNLSGYGTSAPDVGTATGMGGLGIADMIDASNRAYDNFTTGAGWARPPVYDATPSGQKLAKPGVVGVGKFGGFRTDAQMARDMSLMTGKAYVGEITDVPDKQFGDFLGVDTEKGAYTITAGRVPGSTMEVSRVVGEEVIAEQVVGAMGLPATIMLGTSPDFARIKSLETGEEGTYTDVGGIAGILGGPGGKATFGEPEPTVGGSDGGDPRAVASTKPYVPISTRFRSIQQFDPIRSMRFPRAPRPEYGRVPTQYAATGGYIENPEKFAENVKKRTRGYHAFSMGGKVYGIAPDERNPGQYVPFGGTMDEIRNAMGTTYGYEPTSIDFNKFPGEQGFGQDLVQQPVQGMKMGGLAGFVGARPEQVSEEKTIADDVTVDVPEGTFVLNAPAVERAGSDDVQRMLEDATQKANAAGVDIEKEIDRISSEGLVPLAVSAGEVLVDPVRAKIIGLGRLEKINNRGKEEVEQRLQESEQAPEKPQPTDAQGRPMSSGGMASEVGGFIADMTPVVGEIKSGAEAYEAYQKGDVPGMIMGALGAIPIAGKFLKPAGKVAKELADFKPDAILYHATDKDFGKLATQQDVGVHLGSLKVADERAKNISKPTNVDESGIMTTDGIPLDEVPEYKEGTSIRPYAVKFGKVFKTDDALAWDQASAAAETILKSKDGSKLSPDAKKQIQKVRVETESLDSAVDAGVDFDVLNIQGLKKINETLRKEGYDTIQYRNRGEVPGEADYERATFNAMPNELREKSMEDSYIFLDPDKSLRSNLTGKMASGGKVSQGFISKPR